MSNSQHCRFSKIHFNSFLNQAVSPKKNNNVNKNMRAKGVRCQGSNSLLLTNLTIIQLKYPTRVYQKYKEKRIDYNNAFICLYKAD